MSVINDRNRAFFAMSFPALDVDGVIMQGHADYCAENGHATHHREGKLSAFCPRCGTLAWPGALDPIALSGERFNPLD